MPERKPGLNTLRSPVPRSNPDPSAFCQIYTVRQDRRLKVSAALYADVRGILKQIRPPQSAAIRRKERLGNTATDNFYYFLYKKYEKALDKVPAP